MIDFHTHTFLSDGVLNPSELVRRAHVIGYRAIGLTDHGDGSNLDFIIPRIVKVARELNQVQETLVIPGIELTHVPPALIGDLTIQARDLGAVIVVTHGETPVEPVAPGTNMAAIKAKVDILAHPGLLTEEEADLAAENSVRLEITARGGHSLTNGHVAKIALKSGAKLVIDTDSHAPENLINLKTATKILRGAGLDDSEAEQVLHNNEEFLELVKKRL